MWGCDISPQTNKNSKKRKKMMKEFWKKCRKMIVLSKRATNGKMVVFETMLHNSFYITISKTQKF